MHFLVALALLEEERYWWFQMVDTCHHRSAVDWSHVRIPILSSIPRIIYWWTGCRTAYPSGWTFIYQLRGNRLQCFSTLDGWVQMWDTFSFAEVVTSYSRSCDNYSTIDSSFVCQPTLWYASRFPVAWINKENSSGLNKCFAIRLRYSFHFV